MSKTYRPVSSADLAAQLNASFASGEPHQICQAIGKALGDFNIAEMARETGLARQSIYRAFQTHTELPNFTTILAVLTAMGLQLQVAPNRKPSKAGSIRRTTQARATRPG
ncbi:MULTISPECIES: DNA-binding protein [Bradyrhizobium]|uniref:helix-turn-helix domain-containing transcriptional regulator n=1 Tax=Bradyrhizobium TaxID=374 RepID=UPI001EDA8DF9|nr:putative addiction module antidote protein [Bradyrhizobium zhengyangense]MCG2645588.1 putative addiction module antidote protein [Bradyrhizobium zhengyangense]